jgi:hypothetical protein
VMLLYMYIYSYKFAVVSSCRHGVAGFGRWRTGMDCGTCWISSDTEYSSVDIATVIKVIVRGTLESILTARAQLFNKTFFLDLFT